MSILQEESNLMEIVKLIGEDVLPDEQRAVLEIARVIRLGFLQQNAYHKDDTYVPMEKQNKMMETILHLYDGIMKAVSKNIVLSSVRNSGICDEVIRMKYNIPNDDLSAFDTLNQKITDTIEDIIKNN